MYFEGRSSTFATDIDIVLGLIVSASAIYSYFHKTPFPKDFNLIIVCMVIYYSASGAAYVLKHFVTKEWFTVYITSFRKRETMAAVNDDLKNVIEASKKDLEGATLKIASKLPMFSEFYTLTIEVTLASGKVLSVGDRNSDIE